METANWKSTLNGPGDCLSAADLEAYASQTVDADRQKKLAAHLEGCPACRTELALFEEFTEAAVRPEEAADVNYIESRLVRERAPVRVEAKPERTAPWWRTLFLLPTWRTASVALASLVLIGFVGLLVRNQHEPAINTATGEGSTWRSNKLEIVSPSGDVLAVPTQLSWQGVAKSADYQVQVLEVDRTVLWTSHATDPQIALPAAIASQLRPGKTVLWQVTALDTQGRALAQSDLHSFRVAPASR